jgi:predicted enzyme related to lactoylglutathione lyase
MERGRVTVEQPYGAGFASLPSEVGVLLVKVNRFPEMLSFYRDKLGLPVSDINPGGEDEPLINWVRFETRGTAIELFAERPGEAGTLPLPRKNSMIIAFKVSDIRAVYEELTRRGIGFMKGIGEAEWGWYVHFTDPEGNRLQLYQPKPGY